MYRLAQSFSIVGTVAACFAATIFFLLGIEYEQSFYGLHPYVAYPLAILSGLCIPVLWWFTNELCNAPLIEEE